jgi:hypothetical protein
LVRSHTLVQTVLLTTISVILLARFYGLNFSDAVTSIYFKGGIAFVNKLDPYQVTLADGIRNQFKYSPLFAVIIAAVAKMTRQFSADNLWNIFGIAFFYYGLSRWIDLSRRWRSLLFFAVLAVIVEVNVSATVKQINALIAGMILVALAEFRDERPMSAGAILMIATNFKVYPLVFLVAVGLVADRRYWIGALWAGLAAFLIPVAAVGWSHNWHMHLAWVRVVLQDSGGEGTLDFYSTLQRLGLPAVGRIGKWLILLVGIPLFLSYPRLTRKIDWRIWVTFGLATLLLLSPRTEVFTFVLLAPGYVFTVAWFEDANGTPRIGGQLLCTIIAVAVASCAFTTESWTASEHPIQTIRVAGALAFWLLTGSILIRQAARERFITSNS